MKPLRHIILYATALLWDVTICWPAVLLINLFWGHNLHWAQNPDPEKGDGKSLWCELELDSWPARSWYRHKENGEYIELPPRMHERWGKWHTWGGTTLGHGGFYGPGRLEPGKWLPIQEHEHTHVEQFEASMLRAFLVGGAYDVVMFFAGAHAVVALVSWAVCSWMGYLLMGIPNWLTAWLRGEDPYRGSHHEEAAYAIDELYEQEMRRAAHD